MNDFVNTTVKGLQDVRDEIEHEGVHDERTPDFLNAIDSALAILLSLTYHAIFPAQQETCESIAEHAKNRFGWK